MGGGGMIGGRGITGSTELAGIPIDNEKGLGSTIAGIPIDREDEAPPVAADIPTKFIRILPIGASILNCHKWIVQKVRHRIIPPSVGFLMPHPPPKT
jgi:hypothetical protein